MWFCEQGVFGLEQNAWLGPHHTAWGRCNWWKCSVSDCRVADMCLGSHFMSGVAILEQSEDNGDSGHVSWGGDDAGGSYICYWDIFTWYWRFSHVIYVTNPNFWESTKLVHWVVVIVNPVLNQYMKLMFWHLVQTGPQYLALLRKIPTSLALLSEPQLALQGKFCQMWTSFLSHCIINRQTMSGYVYSILKHI